MKVLDIVVVINALTNARDREHRAQIPTERYNPSESAVDFHRNCENELNHAIELLESSLKDKEL